MHTSENFLFSPGFLSILVLKVYNSIIRSGEEPVSLSA
jgi:hypothetical protein